MDQESTPIQKSHKPVVISAIIIAILCVGLFGVSVYSTFTGKAVDTSVVSIDNSPVLGDPNAPVTIYEFSDFSCPYCSAVVGANPQYEKNLQDTDPTWQAPLPKIEETYVKEGKVKIVFIVFIFSLIFNLYFYFL